MAVEIISNAGAAYYEAPKSAPKSEVKTPEQTAVSMPHDTKVVVQSQQGQGSGDATDQNNKQQKRIQHAVETANTRMKHSKTKAEFSYHEATKRISIKIIDEDTDEVIKEIPPQETLEMIEKMWEMAGILVDEKR